MTETISLAILAALLVGAHVAIRCCADAVLHGERHWWMRAVYRAQQRIDYAAFSKNLDEVARMDRAAE